MIGPPSTALRNHWSTLDGFRRALRSEHRILKLLDDDYVQSLVTELVYESNSKHRLE